MSDSEVIIRLIFGELINIITLKIDQVTKKYCMHISFSFALTNTNLPSPFSAL